jgi:DNA-binding GntR family transcriptional regulator
MLLAVNPSPTLRLPDSAPTLADAVADAVRRGVAERQLVPEETYSVYQLAELLGVSRSPVREGLLRLAEAGLVEIARNRGFRVVRPTAHDIAEIFEIRQALEPTAARRAARLATEADRASLTQALAAMAAAASSGDEEAFWGADRALHRAVLLASGNARAAAVVEDLRATTALLGPPTTATGRTLAEIHEEHAPIVRGVLARRPEWAGPAMRRHLTRTERLLVASAEPA